MQEEFQESPEHQYKLRRSVSACLQTQQQLRQIISREAKETIHRLREMVNILKGNLLIEQSINLQKKYNKKQKQQFISSSISDQTQQLIQSKKWSQIQKFFQQVGTNTMQITDNLYNISNQIQQILSDQMPQDPLTAKSKHNVHVRRSFSATSQAQQITKQHFVAQIFNFINQTYFPIPLKNKFQQQNKKKLAIYILQIQTKLSTIPVFVGSIITMKIDITTHDIFDPLYEHIWKHVTLVDQVNKSNQEKNRLRQKIKQDYSKLKLMMKITTAAVVTQFETSQIQIVRKIAFGLSFPRFFFDELQAELRCYLIWRCPKVNNLNSVWNLPERGALKYLKNLIFPKIKQKINLFLPSLNQKEIQKLIIQGRNSSEDVLNNIPPSYNIFQKSQTLQQFQLLILNHQKIKLGQQFQQYQSCYCCQNIIDYSQYEDIVIHIHGGGFIALSSETTQSYTRQWANTLQIPVFSINYRKPPQHRFPIPLYDCLAGYLFIVQKIKHYMNVNPKNIILAGDSAGGNLASALMGLLLKMNYQKLPKGIYLAYPAIDLRQRYSPSRLYSFHDAILLPTLLLLCLKQYLGQDTLMQYEPLASPLLLTQKYVSSKKLFSQQLKQSYKQNDKQFPKRWPRTVLTVGKLDPLYDDSLRFIERLISSGIQAEMIIYKQFSHAFLSLDGVIPACKQAIQDSIRKIRQMINSQQKN